MPQATIYFSTEKKRGEKSKTKYGINKKISFAGDILKLEKKKKTTRLTPRLKIHLKEEKRSQS